jgi:hypothetical protein
MKYFKGGGGAIYKSSGTSVLVRNNCIQSSAYVVVVLSQWLCTLSGRYEIR